MKRKLFLFISLTLLGYLYSFANEHPYRPLVEEGKEWHYKYEIGFMWDTSIQYPTFNVILKMQGDTLIDNKSYKKIYSYIDSGVTPANNTPFGFIREDNKNRIIYGRSNNLYNYDILMRWYWDEFRLGNEYVIFDMNNPRLNSFECIEDTIIAVSKNIEGVEYNGFEWGGFNEGMYLEGLGFISKVASDLFGVVPLISGGQGYLPYIYRIKDSNGTTLYYNAEMDGINGVSIASNSLVVERNGDSLRFIESTPNSNVIEYEIYNMQGTSISHGKVDATGVVNISHLSQGMYIVRAHNSDSYTQIKFLK